MGLKNHPGEAWPSKTKKAYTRDKTPQVVIV
jgi:hypothetical protein